ncbi:uncharacterized protein LODBEIA_P45820 [Lodderomyces beijingensis]|uniref:Biogenesis of lysosome-related organelles complex 1 subunit CNL1 n=1 Tax=Lodderomyces beijingensis TaxID=1775926 RepID=A0ABP0ZQC8_9ASCO
MSRETPRIIHQSLTALSRLIESDTNVSTIDLNLLENLNTNQSLNYIKLENDLNQIERNGNQLVQLKADFDASSELLAQVENKIRTLEEIMVELDSFVTEMETAAK